MNQRPEFRRPSLSAPAASSPRIARVTSAGLATGWCACSIGVSTPRPAAAGASLRRGSSCAASVAAASAVVAIFATAASPQGSPLKIYATTKSGRCQLLRSNTL